MCVSVWRVVTCVCVEWVVIHVCVCVGTIAIVDSSRTIKELQISLFTLEIIQSQQELQAIKASLSKHLIISLQSTTLTGLYME